MSDAREPSERRQEKSHTGAEGEGSPGCMQCGPSGGPLGLQV